MSTMISRCCRHRSNQRSRNFTTQWNSVENNFGRIYNVTCPGIESEPNPETVQVVSIDQSKTDSALVAWFKFILVIFGIVALILGLAKVSKH